MSKVILVPESFDNLSEISLSTIIKTKPKHIHYEPDITPSDLAEIVEPGDEVICHSFIRNAEGLLVGEDYANVICDHGVDKLLKGALLAIKDGDTVRDVIKELAKQLKELSTP